MSSEEKVRIYLNIIATQTEWIQSMLETEFEFVFTQMTKAEAYS